MRANQTASDDLASLYHRAFTQHGVRVFGNLRPVDAPTLADALAIMRTHGRREGRRLAERIEKLCAADRR